MKRRFGLGIAIGGLAAVALSGAALAFSGPTNASFETGTYVENSFGFEQLNAGDTSLDGWTVEAEASTGSARTGPPTMGR